MQELTIERPQSGQPHQGKVFAAVHAHLSDIPYLAGGLCAKLMAEGYTGYLIRTTNDESSGGNSAAQNILSNETEHSALAKALGFKDVFELYYCSHRMNEISPVELRGRLVFLFRLLKADTVLSFRPSPEGDPESDHWITGRAVEEASWTAGLASDFHEHFEAGIQPHPVSERYYFHARPGQPFNHVVDISPYIGTKVDAIVQCRSQGNGNAGSALRARLAKTAGACHCWATTTEPPTGHTRGSSCSKNSARMRKGTISNTPSGSITPGRPKIKTRKSRTMLQETRSRSKFNLTLCCGHMPYAILPAASTACRRAFWTNAADVPQSRGPSWVFAGPVRAPRRFNSFQPQPPETLASISKSGISCCSRQSRA